jgi:Xaa-Pro aminopeptidase
VASGPNSSLPHHLTGSKKLKNKETVLMDFGAKIDGYCSDITRVVFLGKPTDEQKKIYEVVLEAQKRALDSLHTPGVCRRRNTTPGVNEIKARDVDKIARDYLKTCGFKLVHGLGHGVGLSEHEKPRLGPKSRDILKEGMVASLEPGVYLPGKFGIRIEDLVVIEKNGPRVLTKSTKEIIEI